MYTFLKTFSVTLHILALLYIFVKGFQKNLSRNLALKPFFKALTKSARSIIIFSETVSKNFAQRR
jgi:hypothetical protein